MSAETYILKYINKNKSFFIIASLLLGVGLLCHGYMFFNKLPNFDEMGSINGYLGIATPSGRWALPFAGILNGPFSSPAINGFLCSLFLIASTFIISDTLQIKSKLSTLCMGCVLISFPTIYKLLNIYVYFFCLYVVPFSGSSGRLAGCFGYCSFPQIPGSKPQGVPVSEIPDFRLPYGYRPGNLSGILPGCLHSYLNLRYAVPFIRRSQACMEKGPEAVLLINRIHGNLPDHGKSRLLFLRQGNVRHLWRRFCA